MSRYREWRGFVRAHKGWLLLRVKGEDGRWVERSTGLRDEPGNRRAAERQLRDLREHLLAQERARGGAPGPLTVRGWSKRWLEDRRRQGIADADNDEGRLELHILPVVGDRRLEDVQPRHIVEIVKALQADGKAPRTVRNVYSVAKALFRDARIEGVLQGPEPTILTHRQLGKIRDAVPGWRATAVYTRAELEQLVGAEVVPADRRVWYGLLGLGMLRTGEAAGLRWGRVALDVEPLGRLHILTSYDDGTTKTEVERWMPVHPALAALLAEWRLSGWAKAFGRAPGLEDLVCPVAAEPRRKGRTVPAGSMRDRHYAWKRLQRDLRALGYRARRAHDLRRTGVSLAQDDGADEKVLRWGTHAPPRSVMGLYTSLSWQTLCREVAKLQVRAHTKWAEVVAIGSRPGAGDG